MAIKFACSACGKRLSVKDEHAGRQSKCPECGGQVVVPTENMARAAELPEYPPLIPELDTRSSVQRTGGRSEAQAPKRLAIPLVLSMAMLGLAGLIGYLLRGSGSPVASEHARVTDRRRESSPSRNPRIPVEVSYPVIDDVCVPYKRTVDVALNMRVASDVLREIALELKAKETRQYEYTNIFFYLSDHGSNKGPGKQAPWARASFDNGLEIDILGLTIEEERFLLTCPVKLPVGAESLGTWITEKPPLKYRITIYRIGDDWFWQAVYPENEKPYVHDFERLPSSDGIALKTKPGSDRYVIDKDGVLRVYGYEGKLISVPKPLRQ